MTNVLKLFDSYITQFNVNSEKLLYNVNDVNIMRFSDCTTRFKINKNKYVPYDLSFSNIRYLENMIEIMPSNDVVYSFDSFQKSIYRCDLDNKKFYLWNPSFIEDKLYGDYDTLKDNYDEYDITILGILAIIFRRHFYDTAFKNYVEKHYLIPNFNFSENLNMWILDADNCKKLDIDVDFIIHLVDLYNNKNIKFKNDRIPYTFKWMDGGLK